MIKKFSSEDFRQISELGWLFTYLRSWDNTVSHLTEKPSLSTVQIFTFFFLSVTIKSQHTSIIACNQHPY